MGSNSMNIINRNEAKKNLYSRDWKEKNNNYLQALEKFFDIADNIEDEGLRMEIICKMLKCDEILTKLAEENRKNNV